MSIPILRENPSHLNVFTSTTSHNFSQSTDKENIPVIIPKQIRPKENSEGTAKFSFNLEEVKDQLKTIFSFYASFGDRKNLRFLKSNKFDKMMTDAGVKDHSLSQKRLDLLFMAETQHRSHIDFNGFLRLLVKVASFKHQSLDESMALKKIIHENFEPLYRCIIKETDLGVEKTQLSKEIDQQALGLLLLLYPSLEKLYNNYFPWETKSFETKEQISRRSQSSLLLFLKDFELCPNILTKSKAFLQYNEVIGLSKAEISQYFSTEDQGSCFTLHKFIMFLYRITSYLGGDQPEEAVKILLERMQLSNGFMVIDKRLTGGSLSLLPTNNSQISSNSNQESMISPEEEALPSILTQWEDPLKRLFVYYCALGEPMNVKAMKSIKFKRFFKEAGISIDSNSIDFLFIRYKGKTGKLEYEGFLKSLISIAKRLNSNLSEFEAFQWFFQNVLEDFIEKLSENKREIEVCSLNSSAIRHDNHVQLLMELLQDNEILDLLGTVHKSLRFYYEAYSKSTGLMDFESFARFAKDFDIFPLVITKSRLLKIFETLATVFERTAGHSGFIDQHLFVEGLALCAFEVNYESPEPSPFEKVYYFLEKINQSEGVAAVQKKKGVGLKSQNWDLLQEYKKKMGGSSKCSIDEKPNKSMDFEALLLRK